MKISLLSLLFFLLSSLCPAQSKEIAVTIDDLPFAHDIDDSSEYLLLTKNLVRSLVRHQITATGFVNEGKLFRDGQLLHYRLKALQIWLEKRQNLGNHTFSHKSLHNSSYDEYTRDILKGEVLIKEMLVSLKKSPRYFRHPFLHTGRTTGLRDSVTAFLKDNDYLIAPVTIDNSEWIFARAYENSYKLNDSVKMEYIISEYIPYMLEKIRYYEQQSAALIGYNIKQILLIHANRLNADAADKLFTEINKTGYIFIKLEDALKDPAYNSTDLFTGGAGISWLHRWAITRGVSKDFFKGENKVPAEILKISGVESE